MRDPAVLFQDVSGDVTRDSVGRPRHALLGHEPTSVYFSWIRKIETEAFRLAISTALITLLCTGVGWTEMVALAIQPQTRVSSLL